MGEVEPAEHGQDFRFPETAAAILPPTKAESGLDKQYTRETLGLDFPISPEVLQRSVDQMVYDAAATILCGEKETTTGYRDLARRILENLGDVESIKTVALKEKFDSQVELELTNRLNEQAALLLQGQRQQLGTVDTALEKPFAISVLGFPGWQRMTSAERRAVWEEETGAATMFVLKDESVPDFVPTIYLSVDDAVSLLGKKDASDKPDIGTARTLEHEYRHTQRSLSSRNDRLMGILDEAYTNVGAAYGHLRGLIRVLCGTTEGIKGQGFMQAYEKDDEESKKQLLTELTKNFGEEGLLLLAAKPTNDSDTNGLSNLPLRQDKNLTINGELQFVETLLDLRTQKDATWLEKFKLFLKSSEVTRTWIELSLNMYLKRYFVNVDQTEAVHVRGIHDAMNAEVQRRALLGEKGFYDK